MTAKGLRIGNYLIHEDKTKIVDEIGSKKVNEGICYYVGFSGVKTMSWLEHKGSYLVQPISLTEEWLEKFGFDNDGIIENSNFIFSIDFYDCWKISYKEKPLYGKSNVYLEGFWSVHELQNLYYSLTKEELKIQQ